MYQNELTEMKLRSNLLYEENYELQSQLKQLQKENQKVVTRYMELKDKQRHSDTMVCT